MYRSGHLGIGFILSIPLVLYFTIIEFYSIIPIIVIVFSFMSVHPDIDIYLQEKTKGKIQHRGKTHSLMYGLLWSLVILGILLISYYFLLPKVDYNIALPENEIFNIVLLSFYLGLGGIFSHLVGDILTPSGVSFMWPVNNKTYSLGVFYARNVFANFGFLIIGMALLIFSSYMMGVIIYVSAGLAVAVAMNWDNISNINTWKYQFKKTIGPYFEKSFKLEKRGKKLIIDFEDGRKNNVELRPGDVIEGKQEDYMFKGLVKEVKIGGKISRNKHFIVFKKSKIKYRKSGDIERSKNNKISARRIATHIDKGDYEKLS